MATTSEILYVGDISTTLNFPDGSTDGFIIESPNGDNSIEIEIGSLHDRQYRDGNNHLRKGYSEYYVKYIFSYSSHYMDLLTLYLAESIEIPFFIGDYKNIDGFNELEFILLNETVVKNFLSGLRLTKDTDNFESANPVPNGSVSIELQTSKPLTLEDMFGKSFYQRSVTSDETQITTDSDEITVDQI